MEKLKRVEQKLDTFSKALNNLEKAMKELNSLDQNNRVYEYVRESVITRFEYCLELFWKLLKSYLEDVEDIIVPGSPRSIIIEAKNNNLITQEQTKIVDEMITDRNLSSHIYHENIAHKIANSISLYYKTFTNVRDKIKAKLHK